MLVVSVILCVLLGAAVMAAAFSERRRLDVERACEELEAEARLLRREIAYLRSSRW